MQQNNNDKNEQLSVQNDVTIRRAMRKDWLAQEKNAIILFVQV